MTERQKIQKRLLELEDSVKSQNEEIEKLTNSLQTTPDYLLDRDLEEERRASTQAKNDFLRSQGLIP
jgi:hypothetical protein